jgi:hypothetical protein
MSSPLQPVPRDCIYGPIMALLGPLPVVAGAGVVTGPGDMLGAAGSEMAELSAATLAAVMPLARRFLVRASGARRAAAAAASEPWAAWNVATLVTLTPAEASRRAGRSSTEITETASGGTPRVIARAIKLKVEAWVQGYTKATFSVNTFSIAAGGPRPEEVIKVLKAGPKGVVVAVVSN